MAESGLLGQVECSLHARGEGVPASFAIAASWLRTLAEQEAIEAARNAGKTLSNKIRAVAANRRAFPEALRDWYKDGQKGDKPKCS